MKISTVFVVCSTAILMLVACGDDGNGSNNDGGAGGGLADAEEVEDFLFERSMAYRRNACELAFSDCPNQLRWGILESGTNLDECIENQRQRLLEQELDAAALESARRGFDADKASACLDALSAEQAEGTCSTISAADRRLCYSVITGAGEEGEACMHRWDCQNNRCTRETGEDYCYGFCEPVPTMRSEGESCELGKGACDPAENLRCDFAADGSEEFVCMTIGSRAAGEPCVNDRACEDGLLCKDRTCVEAQPAELGEPCLITTTAPESPDDAYCVPGLRCVDLDANDRGTCSEPRDVGSACRYDQDCVDDLYCPFETDTCTEYTDEGDSCSDNEECGPNFYCDESETCVASKLEGEVCENFECAVGLSCNRPESGDRTCQPYLGGESCELPEDA